MKSLILIAVVFSAAVVHAGPPCPGFDPITECEHCLYDRDNDQYAVNPCNPNIFYHCEISRGSVTAKERVCPKCLWFSKDTWGCTITDPDPTCVPDIEPLFTETIVRHWDCCYRESVGPAGPYRQDYRRVTDASLTKPFDPELYYYWDVNGQSYLQACPDGTFFDMDSCQCQICLFTHHAFPCLHSDTKVFCIDFDNDGAERGIYYDQEGSCSIDPWSWASAAKNSLHLPGGPCNIEVPYFKNNDFGEFKLCGHFKTVDASIDQGIAFSGGQPGDVCYPGPIEISLTGGKLFGQIRTEDNDYPLNGPAISDNTWYEVCLSYDGATVELLLDNNVVDSSKASGRTKRTKCDLKFGSNFDSTGAQNFFLGNLDDLCFWRKP